MTLLRHVTWQNKKKLSSRCTSHGHPRLLIYIGSRSLVLILMSMQITDCCLSALYTSGTFLFCKHEQPCALSQNQKKLMP